jgi:hypothetical protein
LDLIGRERRQVQVRKFDQPDAGVAGTRITRTQEKIKLRLMRQCRCRIYENPIGKLVLVDLTVRWFEIVNIGKIG